MEILIIGSDSQRQEVKLKFGDRHQYPRFEPDGTVGLFKEHSVVFDFVTSDRSLSCYKDQPSLMVFADTTFISLLKLGVGNFKSIVFGFCGLPTFVNREMLETSLSKEEHRSMLENICLNLGTEYQVVSDTPGLLTPRVICMIINEAYYTMEEGTASREDIDLAMKLGTNYPYGPFEWCKLIGSKNVCKLLDAMYAETKDSRYKVCETLEKEFS